MPSPQGRYFLCTVPEEDWEPPRHSLPPQIVYIRGQLEQGTTTAYRHWQVLVAFAKKTTVSSCRRFLGGRAHCELGRSDAARDYVWKEDTRIDGTQFEVGNWPIRRNSKPDWDAVWDLAKSGSIESIPANVRLQHYRTIRTIAADFAEPSAMERTIFVFCGRTGTGKSRRAWEEAGLSAYPKDPRSKFWDGYRNQEHVVIGKVKLT